MLALIAGQGALPKHLADNASEPPLVASLARFPPDTLTPDITFRIETLGTFLKELHDKGVTEVCFAGALRRHPIEAADIDAATLPLVPRMAEALQQGDDAALRTVLAFFEEAGFTIRAAHEIAPDLLPEAGSRTAHTLSRDDDEEVRPAARLHAALGRADIGQAIVAHRGQAIAIEGAFGTDWMLDSLKNRPDEGGGVLYKAPKPNQDRRIDLPTIGPETVRRAAAAGLDGVAVEHNGVLVLDEPACVAEADKAGIYLWIRKP